MATVSPKFSLNLNKTELALNAVKNLPLDAVKGAVNGVKALGHAINNNRVKSAAVVGAVALAGLAIAANAYSAEIAEAGVQFLRDNVDVNGTLGDFINRNIVEYAPEQTGILASIGNAIAGVFGY